MEVTQLIGHGFTYSDLVKLSVSGRNKFKNLIEDFEAAWNIADALGFEYMQADLVDEKYVCLDGATFTTISPDAISPGTISHVTSSDIDRYVFVVKKQNQYDNEMIFADVYRNYIKAFSMRRYDASDIQEIEKLKRIYTDLTIIWSTVGVQMEFNSIKFDADDSIPKKFLKKPTPRDFLLTACAESLSAAECELEETIAAYFYCDGVPVEDILA